jgi:hypothetical protein
MLKRTKGRFLLTVLVITGFAGTVNTTAPTKEERKQVVELLKDSKTDLQKEIKHLSASQLDFRGMADRPSIRECFLHIAAVEEASWQKIESAMKAPSRPEYRTKLQLTDAELLEKINNGEYMAAADREWQSKGSWKSFTEAQAAFKATRLQHLKYIKNTTEDLRNHFIELPFGTVDCYQFLLFVASHSERHHEEIRQIISHPAFPGR